MKYLFFYSGIGLFLVTSCSEDTLFKKLSPGSSGVTFNNEIESFLTDSFNVVDFEYMYNGAGVATGDLNNDGLLDLYFAGNFVADQIYLNEGGLKFRDISTLSNISADRWSTGVSMVDINNDGWIDIYVCVAGPDKPGNSRKNYFFINQGLDEHGIPHFEDQAEAFGLADDGYSTMAAFFDYDKDNDLDVYVLTNALETSNRNNLRKKVVDGSAKSNDRLYRNNGDGTFSNVTKDAGILIEGWGLGVCISDINQDGWPDIYVANDFVSNDLIWINQGNGTFIDKANNYLSLQTHNGMGVDVADYNNDMLPDIVVLDMLPEDNYREKMMISSGNYDKQQMRRQLDFGDQYMRNTLQLNQGKLPNGDLKFSEIGYLSGIYRTDWSWAPLFADFDNDGFKDLFIANGYRKDITNMDYILYSQQYLGINMFGTEDIKKERRSNTLKKALDQLEEVKLSNFIFQNQKDLTFKDVTKEWGLDIPSFSNGAIYADLDGDGDLDIVTNNIDDPAHIFENTLIQTPSKFRHFVRIKLQSEKLIYGTKVILSANGKRQYIEYNPYRGYKSTVDPVIHFGTDNLTTIDSILVIWPDNQTDILTNVPNDQLVEINHSNSTPGNYNLFNGKPNPNKEIGEVSIQNYTFVDKSNQSSIGHLVHHDDGYDDFKDTPMLPHQLSFVGPYAAVGDLNGDGVDDIVIGNDYNKPTFLGIQNNTGQFEFSTLPGDSVYEDREIVIFDFDNDQDNDIYIVSGGSRWVKNHANYQDRLYLNDGKGAFKVAVDQLPELTTSGSVVKATDLDNDGDIDLFVGGFLIPKEYPFEPKSYILINEDGKFKDQTAEIAPELHSIGMVTDAKWGDINNDGQVDLTLVGEWMPVTIFTNMGDGTLANQTKGFGLDKRSGWYHSVDLADLDDNGYLDIIVGNTGQNTYYKASLKEPIEIFTKDYDNTGSIDPIMTHYNQGKRYISFYRDQLISQINSAKGRFKRFDDFAGATFEESFTKLELSDAHHKVVTELSSYILENTGAGFIAHYLPNKAQFSTINDINIDDFNRDGIKDILIVGNSNTGDPIRGDLNASFGLLMTGNGDFTFNVVPPTICGFVATGFSQQIVGLSILDAPHLVITRNNNNALLFQINKPLVP